MLDDAYGFEPSIRDLFASRYTNEQLAVFLEPLKESIAGSSIYVINKTVEAHTCCCYLPVVNYLAKTKSKKRQLIIVGTSQKSHALMKELLPLTNAISINAEELIEPVPGVKPEYKEARGEILVGTMKAYLTQVEMQPGLEAEVETLVCEDVPAIINMGYASDLKNLLALLAEGRLFLFSREENSKVEALLQASGYPIKTMVIEDKVISLQALPQEVFYVNKQEKIPLLLGLTEHYGIKRAIVICNQKSTVEYIAKKLEANGVKSGWILSYVSRKEQKETLDSFDEGKINVLVTNDRSLGYIHAKAPFIVNYDIPQTPEAYKLRLHHADNSPEKKAISFACEEFVYGLPDIESYLGFKLPVSNVEQSMLKEDKAKHIQEYRGYGGFGRDRGFGKDRGGRDGGGRDDRRGSFSRDRPRREDSAGRDPGGRDKQSGRDEFRDTASRDRPTGAGGKSPSRRDDTRGNARYSGRADGRTDGRTNDSNSAERQAYQSKDRSHREARQSAGNTDSSKLYTMSAEERLKLYQQKYAGRYEQGRNKNTDQADRKQNTKQPASSGRKNPNKAAEQKRKDETKRSANTAQVQGKNQNPKQDTSGQAPKQGSLLQGILNIFKPKKDPKDTD